VKLLAAEPDDRRVTEELFFATLGRLPTDDEWKNIAALQGEPADRQAMFEDVFWALLNSKGFLFNL
jgi:hypothetical protein